jgi:hypothetical protein
MANTVGMAWEAVKNVVKSSINRIIDKINAVINAINTVATKGAAIIGIKMSPIPTIPLLAHGGIVKEATGGVVTGNGGIDKVPAMLTAGELVLNAAQQRNLASNIGDSKGQTIQINIYGNEFNGSGEDFAEKIGDFIMSRFKTMAQFQSF